MTTGTEILIAEYDILAAHIHGLEIAAAICHGEEGVVMRAVPSLKVAW